MTRECLVPPAGRPSRLCHPQLPRKLINSLANLICVAESELTLGLVLLLQDLKHHRAQLIDRLKEKVHYFKRQEGKFKGINSFQNSTEGLKKYPYWASFGLNSGPPKPPHPPNTSSNLCLNNSFLPFFQLCLLLFYHKDVTSNATLTASSNKGRTSRFPSRSIRRAWQIQYLANLWDTAGSRERTAFTCSGGQPCGGS